MAQAFLMVGDFVDSAWGGPDDGGAPVGHLPCTNAQAAQFATKSAKFLGTEAYRWQYINDVLTERSDNRQTATWGPVGVGSTNGDGDITYDVDEGDTEPTVTFTLADDTPSGDERILFNEDSPLLVTYVNGEATISIKTDVPRTFEIDRTDAYRLSNALIVRVSARKI